MNQVRTLKIIVVGDGGVGKTTFIHRHLTGEFEHKYVATMGAEVHPLRFETTQGTVILKMWDCAGQELFGGLREGYWEGVDGAIVMFDVTSKRSYMNALARARHVREKHPDIPIVFCGNKVDVKNRKVTPRMISQECLPYFDISAKSNYNFEKPFLHLMRTLLKNDGLMIV